MTKPLSERSKSPDLISSHWRTLREGAGQPTIWLALARRYAALDLPWQAGYAARQALRLDATLDASLQLLAIGPWHDATFGDGMLGRTTLAQADLLAQRFQVQLQASPGDWLSRLYLGRLHDRPELAPVASAALEQACGCEPVAGESWHWIGVWRWQAGDAAGAVDALSRVLEIRPIRYGSMMYLGQALLATGQVAAAEKAFARASLSPNPAFLLTLATRVYAHNYWREALEILKKALRIDSSSVPVLLALAGMQSSVYALADCQGTLRQLRRVAPNNPAALLIEQGLLGRSGDAKAHLLTLQQAYALTAEPRTPLASNIAMLMLYHDTLPAQQVADWHRRLCAPIEAASPRQRAFANARTSGRRLRIACVTGDLHRQHPVAIFMLPLLQRIDRTRFDWFVYHTGAMHDDYTRQAKACVSGWTEAAMLDDAALHQAILDAEIDILIDLSGHTASQHLGLFARRGAPVQATFLGYPHSTGMSSIDWLIGDATVSPFQHGPLFSEGIAQLPDSVFCWAPLDAYPLPVPRASTLPVVFGSFNNVLKLTPATIALWAQILHAVPQAQLLLKAPALRDASVREHFISLFAAHGIAGARLNLRGPSGLDAMMQEYGAIDIALDPIPYNGGTTTLQALWMGVPVLAMSGENFVSRMGASFLGTLGRSEWLAVDPAEYVARAVQLAQDVVLLRNSRTLLREQMAASPLCDIDGYVQHFEALLQRMWQAYCEPGRPRQLCLPQHAAGIKENTLVQ